MGFIDRLGESIAETGQGIRKMADQNTLQGDIRRVNKEMESLIYQIGLEMVSNEPEICAEKCPAQYSRLMEAREQAKTLRNQIALMNVVITCPGCGRTVKGVSQFCVNCGSKLPEPNLDPDRDYDLPGMERMNANPAGVCANCGAPLKPGAAFCTNCGTPVQ